MFLMYFAYYSLIRYRICKYFLPFCRFLFILLASFAGLFNLMQSNLFILLPPMLSPRSFMVSHERFLMKGFSWKVSHSGFSPFWIIFINDIIVQLHSFAVPIQFSQHQFIEETVPIVYPWLLCCKQLTIYAWVYFWAILFHWSMSCFYANTILFSYERTVI